MPRIKQEPVKPDTPAYAPALTLEAREQQIGMLAIDLAEKQIREGTASSQVITHFLKIVSTREQLEKENVALKNELTKAKTEQIKQTKEIEKLYADAINALRRYGGESEPAEEYIDDEEIF